METEVTAAPTEAEIIRAFLRLGTVAAVATESQVSEARVRDALTRNRIFVGTQPPEERLSRLEILDWRVVPGMKRHPRDPRNFFPRWEMFKVKMWKAATRVWWRLTGQS